MIANVNYKEIFRLKKMLEDEKIEHEFKDRSYGNDYEFYQICCYDSNKQRYISIIEGERNLWLRRR